jgi:hypothetical protein
MQKYIFIMIVLIWVQPVFADTRPSGDQEADAKAQVDSVSESDAAGGTSPQAEYSNQSGKVQVHTDEIAPPPPALHRTQPESHSEMTIEWRGRTQSPSLQRHNQPLIDGAAQLVGPYASKSHRDRKLHPHFWRTETEWVGIRAGISTYGASLTLSVATLRWKNFYLDIAQFTGGAWKRTVHFFGSTLAGMPFWLSARQEFRLGTGISVGYLRFKNPIDSNSNEFSGSGIYAARVKSYVMLPLQVSYIYHHRQRLALQLCATVAFPVHFKNVFLSRQPIDPDEYDIQYRPFVGASAGLRY